MNTPIPMLLWCPGCGARHIDEGEFATKPHHTHACQTCGLPWRPALVPTCGVQFLPGFKNVRPMADIRLTGWNCPSCKRFNSEEKDIQLHCTNCVSRRPQ